MTNIIRRSHGFQLDHIGLGVPNTEEGVKWVEDQTGAKVDLHDPEPSQFYWSGSLAIGEHSFLEIIGPNPEYKNFQPFAAHIKTLREPELLFWYIAVEDFEAFKVLAHQKSAKLERVEAVNIEDEDEAQARYWRGLIGPGFVSERPNVIQWVKRPSRESSGPAMCQLTDFRLSNPQAESINKVFGKLGIDVPVSKGTSSIGLTIETPKGAWSLENKGMSWTMPGMLLDVAGLWWRTRK